MRQRNREAAGMRPHTSLMVSILAGTKSVEAVAAELGQTEAEVELEVARFSRALETLARPRQTSRQVLLGALVIATAFGLVGARSALAQVSCSAYPGLPSLLRTMCADTPATADDVNFNNKTMADYVAQKLGTLGNANVAMTGTVTSSGAFTSSGATSVNNTLNVTGASTFTGSTMGLPNGSIDFGTATRQMLNLNNAQYGIGVQASTTYFRTGGGFNWYLGGAHSNAQNDPGGGTSLMSLSSAGTLSTRSLNLTGAKYTAIAPDVSGFTTYGSGYNTTWADCGNNAVTAVRVNRSTVSDQMVVEVNCAP